MAATFLRLSAAPANCRVSCHLACGTAGLRRVYEGRAPFMPNLCLELVQQLCFLLLQSMG